MEFFSGLAHYLKLNARTAFALVARHAIMWGHTVQDADQRAWYRRRALRCLERAFSTIHAYAVPANWSVGWGIKGWLMPTEEEQTHLAWSGARDAMQIMMKRKAASETAS
ncbi:MAG TPA: hypothetical protein VGQ19_06595 [Burkholderiales bacterium]|jgi:hypothetical protein|nr:hypothetical protein [Burkholderiales bacterium]